MLTFPFDSLSLCVCDEYLQIKTPAQLDAAVSFFDKNSPEDCKLNEFEEACGVGKSVCVLLAGIIFIS